MRYRRHFTDYVTPALLGAAAVLALVAYSREAPSAPQALASDASESQRVYGMSVEERHRYAARGCREAAEVGLAPAYRGQPGYWPQWDGDHDGISCERWHSAR